MNAATSWSEAIMIADQQFAGHAISSEWMVFLSQWRHTVFFLYLTGELNWTLN